MRVGCRNRLTKLVLFGIDLVAGGIKVRFLMNIVATYNLRVLTTRKTSNGLAFSYSLHMMPLRLRPRIQSYYVRESTNSHARV